MIYVISTPPNKLDKKDRVSGWRDVPLDKKAKKEWVDILMQVKDKGVKQVLASDLDGEAAHLAANELRVPVQLDFVYRRFNVGRHHASPRTRVDELLGALEFKWKQNPDIPLKGGDSLTSYRKRFERNFTRLLDGKEDVLFITDPRTMHSIRGQFDPRALVPNGSAIDRKKIFKVGKT